MKPMEIGRTEKAFTDGDYIYEIKMDGERCLAYLGKSGVDLINRRGRRILDKMPELGAMHERVNGRCILDGELVVVLNGKPDFEEIKRRASTSSPARAALLCKQSPVTFVVFDILYKNGESLVEMPLERRKEILEDTVDENERISLSRYVQREGEALFQSAVTHGLEGIVGKRLDSPYRMGKRSRDWVKCKHTMDDEYVVCGYIRKAQYVGSLVLGQYNAAGEMVYKGHVTLALSSADFAQIEALPARRTPPFKEALPPGNKEVHWVKPSLVCTVEFLHRGTGGLMRHPVYKGLRWDKHPAETLERV